MACHRLRNKNRVLIKFQDLADREAVYQARFGQKGGDKDKNIVVHENLTERRAAQIRVLGKLRSDQEIANYHTRNGNIYARISQDRRYARIDPTATKEEIMQTLKNTEHTQSRHELANKTTSSQYGRSDRANKNKHNLDEFLVSNPRKTRQQTKAESTVEPKPSSSSEQQGP